MGKTTERKILIIAPLPPPYNGQSIATETLINSKIKKLYSLEIINITSPNRTGMSGIFEFKRLTEILGYLFKYLIKIFTFNPDIVYLTISQSSLGFLRDIPFIWISKIFNKKCVIHLHGGYFKNFYKNSSSLYKRIIKKTLSMVDCAVVLSESLKGMFEGIIQDNRIKVIPNCVSPDFILTDEELNNKIKVIKTENKLSLPFKVLYLSNLIPSKGYFDILETALLLKPKNLPIEFTFAGAWISREDEEKVKEFINRHKMNNVKFVGVVTGDYKRNLLLKSNVFVLPSRYEGLPISLLEAMGMGLPAIVTKIGAIPDVVVDGINGFFVQPNEPKDIAEKIEFLLYNKDIYMKMILNNVEKIRSHFTKERYEEAFIKIFRELTDLGIEE